MFYLSVIQRLEKPYSGFLFSVMLFANHIHVCIQKNRV